MQFAASTEEAAKDLECALVASDRYTKPPYSTRCTGRCDRSDCLLISIDDVLDEWVTNDIFLIKFYGSYTFDVSESIDSIF